MDNYLRFKGNARTENILHSTKIRIDQLYNEIHTTPSKYNYYNMITILTTTRVLLLGRHEITNKHLHS